MVWSWFGEKVESLGATPTIRDSRQATLDEPVGGVRECGFSKPQCSFDSLTCDWHMEE